MTNHILSVPDLSCGHCVATVTSALTGIPGLSDCRVDLTQKQVRVSLPADADVQTILKRLAAVGYPAQSVTG